MGMAIRDLVTAVPVKQIPHASTIIGKSQQEKLNKAEQVRIQEELINQQRAAATTRSDKSLIRSIPYSMYGLVSTVPEHGVDKTINVGTQMQKIIAAGIPDDARFTLDGKTYSKQEILKEYYALYTEKLRRGYEEVSGKMADVHELSRMLRNAVETSARGSDVLANAFTVNEYGTLTIPLCDLSTISLSSEFLNAVWRKATTRAEMAGGQFVQMSCFGLENNLHTEFNRDADGNVTGIKAIQVYMPAYSKKLIETLADENGYINIDALPKELREAVSVRIPTEGKHFIAPLRIMGFLPQIMPTTIGAIYGQGEGLQGNAYALPTKDLRVKENNGLKSISAEDIIKNIKKLYAVARENPSKKFKIAYRNKANETTLNGYTGAEMIQMFKDAGRIPDNIYFSKEWVDTGLFAPTKKELTNLWTAQLQKAGFIVLAVSDAFMQDAAQNADDDMRFSRNRRRATNNDLSLQEKKAIQEHIKSLPKDTDTSNGLYYENNGYIYKFNASVTNFEENLEDGDGFEIIEIIDVTNLNNNDKKRINEYFGNPKERRSVWFKNNGYTQRTSNGSTVIIADGKTVEYDERLDSLASRREDERRQNSGYSGSHLGTGQVKTGYDGKAESHFDRMTFY